MIAAAEQRGWPMWFRRGSSTAQRPQQRTGHRCACALTVVGRNACNANTRSADANGRPSGRRASASATRVVSVSWWLAAMCISATQNSFSSPTLVRRPAKEMVRLISVPRHLLLVT